jgi:hypothetical protein
MTTKKDEIGTTPRPWDISRAGDRLVIRDGRRLSVATVEGNAPENEIAANAALIVRAVNAHDALVNALRAASAYIPHDGNEERDAREAAEAALKLAAKGDK